MVLYIADLYVYVSINSPSSIKLSSATKGRQSCGDAHKSFNFPVTWLINLAGPLRSSAYTPMPCIRIQKGDSRSDTQYRL